jgi:hypothetical protein
MLLSAPTGRLETGFTAWNWNFYRRQLVSFQKRGPVNLFSYICPGPPCLLAKKSRRIFLTYQKGIYFCEGPSVSAASTGKRIRLSLKYFIALSDRQACE